MCQVVGRDWYVGVRGLPGSCTYVPYHDGVDTRQIEKAHLQRPAYYCTSYNNLIYSSDLSSIVLVLTKPKQSIQGFE